MADKKELSLDLVKSQLTPTQRLTVNQEALDEIHRLAEDPDYGEEFIDSYLMHMNVWKENNRCTHERYINAVKFFTLVESRNSLTNAYIKVFPERYEQRRKNHPEAEEADKSFMRAEASRYNNSVTVNDIRKIATVPVQLIHRHILHEAILEQAKLMRSARSEMVKQKAGATLIAELKPTEDATLKIEVDDGSKSAIEDLREATIALAIAERRSVEAGVPLSEIAERKIIDVTPERVDDDAGED